MCRSWRELSNAYLLAKFGFDTAVNEPSKVWHPNQRVALRRGLLGGLRPLGVLELGRIGQTSEGSFSAVSKPNFASKYAFESSRRDLHNVLLCAALLLKY